jgi:hypothetical protein
MQYLFLWVARPFNPEKGLPQPGQVVAIATEMIRCPERVAEGIGG